MKQHREFQYVYRKVKASHSKSLTLFYLPQDGIQKVGFTASKKVGNAVARNRSKRRMRSLFREFSTNLNQGTYILVAKDSLKSAPYDVLQDEYKKVLKRSKGWRNA